MANSAGTNLHLGPSRKLMQTDTRGNADDFRTLSQQQPHGKHWVAKLGYTTDKRSASLRAWDSVERVFLTCCLNCQNPLVMALTAARAPHPSMAYGAE